MDVDVNPSNFADCAVSDFLLPLVAALAQSALRKQRASCSI
jgi:hypothetical protein